MKANHTALRCWHRYQSENIPQALAPMTLHDNQNAKWYPDTGASAHMTADPSKLHTLSPY